MLGIVDVYSMCCSGCIRGCICGALLCDDAVLICAKNGNEAVKNNMTVTYQVPR